MVSFFFLVFEFKILIISTQSSAKSELSPLAAGTGTW